PVPRGSCAHRCCRSRRDRSWSGRVHSVPATATRCSSTRCRTSCRWCSRIRRSPSPARSSANRRSRFLGSAIRPCRRRPGARCWTARLARERSTGARGATCLRRASRSCSSCSRLRGAATRWRRYSIHGCRTGDAPMTLLDIKDLTVTYATEQGPVPAVRGVDLTVDAGQTVGVAGESGCGKSTLVAAALRLLPRSATVTGQVLLDGNDVLTMKWGELRAVRWAQASIVFQGAMSSLNPVQKVSKQIAEPILLHEKASERAARRRVGELLEQVGITPSRMDQFPHQFSG